jgi:hypothetical protein
MECFLFKFKEDIRNFIDKNIVGKRTSMSRSRWLLALGVVFLGTVILSPLAEARVKEMKLSTNISPAFDGLSFGSIGQYELLKGTATGELNPADWLNSGIVNLEKAPKNSNGYVEYKVNVTILKPIDLTKGNRRIFYEIANRGSKLANFWVNSSSSQSEPTWKPDDIGNGFLMRQGYTVVWSGWQGDSSMGMYATLPIPTDSGQAIVGTSRDEWTDTGTTSSFSKSLAYTAANTDQNSAILTVREKESDPPTVLSASYWKYNTAGTQITITRPTGYDSGAIYEFIYTAKNPKVMGIGFAAIRDVISFLRYRTADDISNLNPLTIDNQPVMEKVYAVGISQSGRVLRDFIYQGFNEDESHRITFDGVIPVIAGSKKSFVNYAFAQPGRTHRQHEEHTYPGDQFPFSYGVTTDPISGQTDGILAKCQNNGTCPKIMHLDSENEVWQARGSLVVTNTTGTTDLILPQNVRAYLFAGTQHQPGGNPSKGICKQLSNPMDYRPFLRALIVAMDKWVSIGNTPPPTKYANLANGTLVSPLSISFPTIPGGAYTGLVNYLNVLDHNTQPPSKGALYPSLVAAVDSDGNSITGLRHPLLQVPIGTFTGWNIRSAGNAENELCSLNGSYIPFADSAAERIALGDSRPSIEERYRTHSAYVTRVLRATLTLRQQGYLLADEADKITQDAIESDIGR